MTHSKFLTEDLALFASKPINVGETHYSWVDIEPVYSTSSKGSVKFHIPGTGSQYTNLNQSLLKLSFSVTNRKGEFFSPVKLRNGLESSALPVNNVLHSVWSQNDTWIGGKLVSTSGTNYAYKAYFDTLLDATPEKLNRLEMQGFVAEGGNMDSYNENDPHPSSGLVSRGKWFKPVQTKYSLIEMESGVTYKHVRNRRDTGRKRNEGEGDAAIQPPAKRKRRDDAAATDEEEEEGTSTPTAHDVAVAIDASEIFYTPTTIEFVGPLLSDICLQKRHIINGVDIDFHLEHSKDEFRLLVDHPEPLYARLENIRMSVAKVGIDSSTIVSIEKRLEQEPVLYPFVRTEIRTFELAKGTYKKNFEDVFQGETPTKLLMAMVDTDAYTGNYKRNPFRFRHNDIESAGFLLDTEPVPHIPFSLNIRDNAYLDLYSDLHEFAGKTNTSLAITRETMRQGHNLIPFLIDPTVSPTFDYLSSDKSARTRLEIGFKKPLETTVTVILYATFPEIMQIDSKRLVCLQEKEKSAARLRGNLAVCGA